MTGSTCRSSSSARPRGAAGLAPLLRRQLQPGDTVQLAGPKNLFRLDETADHYVLIAAGIGITPMLAMADRLQRLGKPYVLHYAGRSRAQMALLSRALRDHGPALTLHVKDEGGRMHLPTVVAGRAGQPPGVRLRPQPPD
jgi:ferredoxin-NADP reductase